jgi:hypothetical protein
MLALAALALIGFAAIGWVRGWYSVKTTPTASGGRNINIDVNSPKISEDLSRSKNKLRDLLTSDKQKQEEDSFFPNGVPTSYQTPQGPEFVLPGIDPEVIDLSDYQGSWWSAPRKK